MLTAMTIVAVAAALVKVAQALPAIIWAIRCPSDSDRFVCPKNRQERQSGMLRRHPR